MLIGLARIVRYGLAEVKRRTVLGFCPFCDYDLRGAEHVRCPECGSLPASFGVQLQGASLVLWEGGERADKDQLHPVK